MIKPIFLSKNILTNYVPKTFPSFRKDLFFLGALTCIGGVSIYYQDRKAKKYLNKITVQSCDASISQMKNRQCVLFIETQDDLYDAKTKAPQNFKELENNDIVPIVRKINNATQISQIVKQLQKNQNRIDALVITAHGSESGICFENQNLTGSKQDSSFNLPPDSYIVLYSCETAKSADKLPSILKYLFSSYSLAEKISRRNPTATVIASPFLLSTNSTISFDFIKEKEKTKLVITPYFQAPLWERCLEYKNKVTQDISKAPNTSKAMLIKTLGKNFCVFFQDFSVSFKNGKKINAGCDR